jgi:hypothetical protein
MQPSSISRKSCVYIGEATSTERQDSCETSSGAARKSTQRQTLRAIPRLAAGGPCIGIRLDDLYPRGGHTKGKEPMGEAAAPCPSTLREGNAPTIHP